MFTDLGHTAFSVADMDVSLAFYEKLGIRESFRLNNDDGSLMLVYLHIGGDRFLELFPGGGAANNPQSFKHICLITENIRDDVERLRAAGVPIDREVSEGKDHNLQAWTHDPDGNSIEMMQLSEQSPQRRTALASVAKS